MMRGLSVLLLVLVLPVFGAPAKQKPGKAKGQSKVEPSVVAFLAADRRAVVEFYRGGSSLPPGLAKRESLPPGLEKQLRRKGTLPPGLAKRIAPFPLELERRLGALPPGCARGVVGGMAVLYRPETGLVLDSFVIAGR